MKQIFSRVVLVSGKRRWKWVGIECIIIAKNALSL